MRVKVDVTETELEGDYKSIDGITVTCTKCGREVEIYGTEEASIKRGCAQLREECGERNFYYYHEEESPRVDPVHTVILAILEWMRSRGYSSPVNPTIGALLEAIEEQARNKQ